MKTKICPCCDQPIQGIYCKGCKKIVWKPVEQEINYFLNTRHPEFEKDCTFHNEIPSIARDADSRYSGTTEVPVRNAAHRMTAAETEEKKAQMKARMAARKQGQKPAAGQAGNVLGELFGRTAGSSHPTVLNGNVARKKKSTGSNSAARKIMIGIIIYLIVVFGGVFGMAFGNFLNALDDIDWEFGTRETVMVPEPMTAPAVNFDWDVSAPLQDALEDTPLNDWERTDEEVKEAGVACTGYGHFGVGYSEDLRSTFESCVKDAGFRIWEETVYSYNSQMDFDSWYETVYEFAIDSDDDYIGTIEIETDTATAELHGFSVYSGDEKHFHELVNVILKFMQETGVVRRELPSAEEFYEEARWKNEDTQREMGFVMLAGMEVSCYVPDEKVQDFFSMSMYAPGYMSVVDE